jgi:hypothetical protein
MTEKLDVRQNEKNALLPNESGFLQLEFNKYVKIALKIFSGLN